jgi:hypothetical protein
MRKLKFSIHAMKAYIYIYREREEIKLLVFVILAV